jgi:uncharacterized iron-regulated membrane protein
VSRVQRSLYDLHAWTGAGVGFFLFLVCLTGSLTVYRDEIRVWEHAPLHSVHYREAHATSATQALEVFAAHYDLSAPNLVALRLPGPDHPAYGIIFAKPGQGGLTRAYVHPETAEFLGEPRTQLADFLFQLHASLLMRGKIGRYVVGLAGVAYLVLIASGVVIHRRLLRNLFTQRWGRSLRLSLADAHRALGVWPLLFHLVIASSGTILALKDLLVMVPTYAASHAHPGTLRADQRRPPTKRAGEPKSMAKLDTLVERARAEVAGFVPTLVVLTAWGDANAEVDIGGSLPGHLLAKNEAARVRFSGVTGDLRSVENSREHAAARRAYDALTPLHYGDYGGATLRACYFAFGLAATSLTWTGTWMWFERARRRAPKLDAIAGRQPTF